MATDSTGKMMGVGSIEEQARHVFSRIERVLKVNGATLDNVVTMSVFLKDINDLDRFCEVRREVFKRDFPASTAVQVSAFAHPEGLVEVNAIAVLD